MTKEEIVQIIAQHICEIIPELKNHEFKPTDKLVDLGANSMDRAEIVMMTMESLSLQVPLVHLSGAQNIGELADSIYEKLQLF
ncbi:polyketide biosynthesis acyl carrier protein [Paenibacillus forsythiae]|uniref:Polyketide biosynthesis acyl carrier protein n=1 Tax=Paenibacillus forsythiae TaxID=365616 RepID=A0ABU3HE02_9BACL|nr:acyl carrier protein [Paenibacillus forsythiae]MDT3429044.1 polyketide biosynthesis acyl carrier protein [Paenibacillus forsythiae]